MRGWAVYNKGYSAANVNESLGYFERALQLDPDLVSAQLAVAGRLAERALAFAPDNANEDLARADAMVAKALSAEPDSPDPHVVKAQIMHVRHQFSEALAELRRVLDENPNIAYLYSLYGLTLLFDGRTAEAIPQFETARRLSPRDPLQSLWEFQLCHAYAHLAQWEKAADWCEKSVATNPALWMPHVDLAAADGWLGRDAEAKTAIAGLLKLRPGYTVQQWANEKWSNNPQFQREYVGIVEGLRKAGLPEK